MLYLALYWNRYKTFASLLAFDFLHSYRFYQPLQNDVDESFSETFITHLRLWTLHFFCVYTFLRDWIWIEIEARNFRSNNTAHAVIWGAIKYQSTFYGKGQNDLITTFTNFDNTEEKKVSLPKFINCLKHKITYDSHGTSASVSICRRDAMEFIVFAWTEIADRTVAECVYAVRSVTI